MLHVITSNGFWFVVNLSRSWSWFLGSFWRGTVWEVTGSHSDNREPIWDVINWWHNALSGLWWVVVIIHDERCCARDWSMARCFLCARYLSTCCFNRNHVQLWNFLQIFMCAGICISVGNNTKVSVALFPTISWAPCCETRAWPMGHDILAPNMCVLCVCVCVCYMHMCMHAPTWFK